jgi:hypothetical protein
MKKAATTPTLTPDAPDPKVAPEQRRELAWIETLFDRRIRAKDTKHSFFWNGHEVLIVKNGKTSRLCPVGVIRGPYLDEQEAK